MTVNKIIEDIMTHPPEGSERIIIITIHYIIVT